MRLYDRIVDEELPADHAAFVREALAAVAAGDWEAGAERLRGRYESVCETEHPAGERATCHLLDEAE